MRKIVFIAAMTLVSMLCAQTKISSLKSEAMAKMSSFNDDSNFGTYAQRVLTGDEKLGIGTEISNGEGYGLMRFKMLDNMALQININTND